MLPPVNFTAAAPLASAAQRVEAFRQRLRGQRVTVMGLGRFGGGLGAARFLASCGAIVTVTDRKPESEFAEVLPDLAEHLAASRVRLALGGHQMRDFAEADLVVANPAVPTPWENQYLQAARAASVPVTTEIAILAQLLPTEADGVLTVGITGSVGKSTTTAMIHHALSALLPANAGQHPACVLGGNIGGSLLDRLPLTGVRVIVLELSSAMLHWIGALTTWAPAISVCTNLSPNHLDWHGTLDHYASSKQRLLTHQHPHDDAILGPTLAHWASLTSARASIVQGPLQHALAIPGAHNRLNAAVAHRACAAVLARLGMPVDADAITAALAAFPGLEHRLALCHTSRDGRKFYNDSKCTTVAACQQAIASLAEDAAGRTDHLHLIVGGDAKGQDVTPIARLAPTLAGMYAIGRDGALFASRQPTVQTCETLDNAVRTAVARMKPGHVLLLSPACASWDQFPNYEYRGRQFTQACQTAAP